MIATRAEMAKEALEKSLEIREEADLDFKSPLNIFDLCGNLTPNVRVLFVDYSMEGCYSRCDRPLIKISALRPLVRRVFNCVHELGHHVFGHGSTIDELRDETETFAGDSPDEFLVNAFAGFLLMPKLGVRRAFSIRGWKATAPTPEQVYAVACHFGVGYATLANHLVYGLREISSTTAKSLLSNRLPQIRRSLIGPVHSKRLQIIDQHYDMPVADTEVGTHLALVRGATVESNRLPTIHETEATTVVEATHPGLFRACGPDGWADMIRVSQFQYSGWSQYRHLGLEEDDE